MNKIQRVKRHSKRVAVGIVGGVVVVIGIIAIPYPGPGWLIVFAGLAILATEFDWAKRILDTTKGKYDAWQSWLRRQNLAIRFFFWLLTAIIVAITVYLVNGYGIINDVLNLGQNWLRSPLPIFKY